MKNVGNKIAYIMEHFDFIKCHKVMEALDWNYADFSGATPSISKLRATAHSLLVEISEGKRGPYKEFIATGGFVAQRYKGGLSLSFVVEDQDSEFWND